MRSARKLVLFLATVVVVGTAGGLPSTFAFAQNLAGKQLHLVVPAPPGGGFDSFAREIAQKVAENLKISVVVENRPGGGHVVGTAAVAHAKPDGSTMLMVGTNHTTNPIFKKNLPYDSRKDFETVMVMARTPFVLVVTRSLPVKSPQELAAYAKANPGKLNFTASQTGGASQLVGELLKREAAIDMTFVPYQGSAPALTDVLAGRVQVMIDAPVTAMPYVKTGALRALGVTSGARSPYLPDIPTLAESGWPQIDVTAWVGLLVPAGTSKENVRWINRVFAKTLSDSQLQKSLAAQYWTVTPDSPEEMRSFLEKEMNQWADLAKRTNLTVK